MRTSTVLMTGQRKLSMKGGKYAHAIARRKKDPVEKKYEALYSKLKMLKKQIGSKYKGQAMSAARRGKLM